MSFLEAYRRIMDAMLRDAMSLLLLCRDL